MANGVLSAALAFFMLLGSAHARAEDVLVFAAASTTDALNEVGEVFKARSGHRLRPSYAASSTLAKQIEQGAPAQIFLSADVGWMDYLAAKQLIEPASRTNLVTNTLVLVAPVDSALPPLLIGKDTDLAALLGLGRLATGNPDHVPVGRYARQALEAMGQWQRLELRLARAESARAALALVERGEAPLGIVYATDAAAARNVKVVGSFSSALHAPIVYPVALIKGQGSAAAHALLVFLRSDEAKALFRKHGFKVN